MSRSTKYDSESIRVMRGVEGVRQNPAMYIGSTDSDGLHRLVFEVVDNAIDEAVAGFCQVIDVTLEPDGWIQVQDDGRGIPVDVHPAEGIPGCEVALTRLHAGAKFSSGFYGLTTGTHGIGLSCVNALSAELQLDIHRDGVHYRQLYAEGVRKTDLEAIGETELRGTRIRFLPDRSVFDDSAVVSRSAVAVRLQELAFLYAGTRITLDDTALGSTEVFLYRSGIEEYLELLNSKRSVVHGSPIRIRDHSEEMELDAVLQWTTEYEEHLRSYVNGNNTSSGGAHVAGLRKAIAQTVNRYAVESGLVHPDQGERIEALDTLEGLSCVLSLRLRSPAFDGQTKTRLTSSRAESFVQSAVAAGLMAALQKDSHLAVNLVHRALDATRARVAARRAGARAHYGSARAVFEPDVYRQQFGIRSRNWHDSAAWLTDKELLQKHANMLQIDEGGTLLDVCCGSGIVGSSFRGKVRKTVGLDITPEMARMARSRLDEVRMGDVYDLPFVDGAFDVVVTREVLHLLPAPEHPVSEIYRVLRPGGQFIVGQVLPYSADDAPWMFRIFKKKQPLLCNMFQEQDFRDLLLGAGFVGMDVSEYRLWESIDVWIDTWETSNLHRHEIRQLFKNAPQEARAAHPFKIASSGEIRDLWRWCIFSVRKPA